MNYPEVSIIILNWNGVRDTLACLKSLKKITYPNYRVIVIDNGSSGNDAEILKKEYGDYIHLIANERNYGFAEGNNIGIRYALEKSNYVLLLNNDTVVHPKFLDELVKITEQDHSIGIAGPKIYFYSSRKRLQFTTAKINMWTGRAIHFGAGEIDQGNSNNVQETDYCQGSCFLIRKEVVQKIGFMDIDYFAYWEESDYCIRAKKEGFRIVHCPRAKIWHKGLLKMWDKDSSSNARSVAVYYFFRNTFLFMRKNANRQQIVTFLLYFFTVNFWMQSGHLILRRRSLISFVSFLKGIKDGLQLLMHPG